MQLKQSVTFFMMPFRIDGAVTAATLKDSIWQPCAISFDKSKLFEHVGRILNPDRSQADSSFSYDYYALKPEAKAVRSMLSKTMAIRTKGDDGSLQTIPFTLGQAEETVGPESFFSPKLIICNEAGIGMLMLSVQMSQQNAPGVFTLEHLMALNYALFKTYPADSSQTQPIYLSTQTDVLSVQASLQEADEQQRRKLESRLKGQMASLPDKAAVINEALLRQPGATDWSADVTAWSWNMGELTARLMHDLRGQYHRFDDFRLHVFTYLQVGESECGDSLRDDFIRIVMVQNHNYQVLADTAGKDASHVEQTFRNIYIGASEEGGGILTLLPDDGDRQEQGTFVADFMYSTLTQSYLWTYLMAQMQRFTLLNMETRLTSYNFNRGNTGETRNKLRRLIRQLTACKVNSQFVDISDHRQQNQFYRLCTRCLRLTEQQRNVEQKVDSLREYLEMLTEQGNEAMERRKTNLAHWLAVGGGVLALFSSMLDSWDLFDENHLDLMSAGLPAVLHGFFVLGCLIVVGIAVWLVVDSYLNSAASTSRR